jgi:hypothetical protein
MKGSLKRLINPEAMMLAGYGLAHMMDVVMGRYM